MWETENKSMEAIDENYQGKLPKRNLLTTLNYHQTILLTDSDMLTTFSGTNVRTRKDSNYEIFIVIIEKEI